MALTALSPSHAQAEILALLNYETRPEQIVRKEGLAVVDVDPESPNFGRLLMEIPLPRDLVAHHIYFNHDKSKAYISRACPGPVGQDAGGVFRGRPGSPRAGRSQPVSGARMGAGAADRRPAAAPGTALQSLLLHLGRTERPPALPGPSCRSGRYAGRPEGSLPRGGGGTGHESRGLPGG